MQIHIYLLLLALIMSVLDAFMMISIKKYYIGHNTIIFGLVLPMLIYSMHPLLFYKALPYEGIGVYNLLWNSMSNLFVLLAGIMLFAEHMSTEKYIGVVLTFIGIILLASE
jgi:multidrug transporter EmrE-like cation transporter